MKKGVVITAKWWGRSGDGRDGVKGIWDLDGGGAGKDGVREKDWFATPIDPTTIRVDL